MTKEAMTLALEALTKNSDRVTEIRMKADAIKALEEALAKQEQDMPKIGCVNHDCDKCKKQQQGEPDKYVMDIECTKCGAKQSGILTVNATPQPAQKPLTDEQIATISVECATVSPSDIYFARAIEAAHGIKENT